ncbi:hypothetical protein MLD38_007797 [Melastoma candidum]|uniref:Uncharacterized protein n=1 Tax=Melastoma candidum TaxID=119954 RepID=A0ACB9RRF1_9MYRT|nr:hypothetical protein MLD38_007797 [Melastoma candidum]
MRTLCDACESAAAVVFCAADEAALCHSCDEKVHMCNKLASRHVRVGLASPSDVPRCDICENAPDGTSLCLQCDMIVHVGGKRTHGRYLLLRQRVEFPGDKSVPNDQALTLVDQGHPNKVLRMSHDLKLDPLDLTYLHQRDKKFIRSDSWLAYLIFSRSHLFISHFSPFEQSLEGSTLPVKRPQH